MRKAVIFLILSIICFQGIGQSYDDFAASFDEFAKGVSTTLPFNALVGLNWSDSYIGNFPHFGIGVTTGATFMPYVNLQDTFTLLGIDPSAIGDPMIQSVLDNFGMPFPAFSAELRLGGFVLPFDIGFKLGLLPSEDFVIPLGASGLVLNYFTIGGDVRFGLIKQWFMIPSLSVGGGVTYQEGSMDIPGLLGSNITLTSVGPYTLELTDPILNFNWKTFVLDAKAQASWDLFLITPYVGTGVSYGIFSEAGGGIKTQLVNQATGQPLTPAEEQAIITYYQSQGEDPPDLSSSQILVSYSTPPAFAFRIYGGISTNFFMARIDAMVMYNILSGGIGGSLNVRLQI